MIPDPSTDDTRTVFCKTCEEWRHPRHACARDSDHETMPLPVLRLREEGPLVMEEFVEYDSGTGPETRRRHGIAKFDLLAHANGPSSTFGMTRSVYYLADEHDPASVIEAWIGANRDTLAGRGLTTENISRALSKKRFKEAWQGLRKNRDFDVLDEPDRSSRGGGQDEQTECPFCGEEIARLPTHLPCEGSSNGA